MKYWLATGMLVFAASTSGLAQGRTDPQLDQLAVAFAQTFNQKDAIRIAAFYTEDAVVMAPNMPEVKGRANIEAYYRKGFASMQGTMHNKPSESSISGTMAFEAGSSSMTMGNPPKTETGKYVVIYKRVGNEWKIAYDIFNDD